MKRTIFITGSSRGIGKAIALYLAKQGYDLVLHCRSQKRQAEAVVAEIEKLGQSARLLQFDIGDRTQCAEQISQDIEAHGAYYGVVCNAGITADNAFPALTGEEWDSVIHTNLDSFYNVLQPVIMPMIRRRKPGRIVTLSSVSGIMGNRGQVNYSAAKAGIIGATKALALELAKRDITVNCVAPGLIATEMLDELSSDVIQMEEIKKMIPARRIGDPKEVAAAVAFLMSEDAAYITRQVISVNGGLC
ncbi:3-oxoacyl-ACP reductase FabG [Methyloglobulus sp.]|uniref:3-oxoacyl-ACP reductase FabG n=1 Tax=Methyloglobulus sp. TaxID=2518622 RepID=UPI0032B8684A